MSTTPTTSNLVPKRFWSQMAWQYLTVPYHGYHKGWEAYLLWKFSLKDHASNAAESVDTNLRGLNFSVLFLGKLGMQKIQNTSKHLAICGKLWWSWILAPERNCLGNISSFGFGRLLVLRRGKKHAMLEEGDWNQKRGYSRYSPKYTVK